MELRLVVVLMVSGSLNMTEIVLSRAELRRRDSTSCPGTGCRCCRVFVST
jgi:hypothetical protein